MSGVGRPLLPSPADRRPLEHLEVEGVELGTGRPSAMLCSHRRLARSLAPDSASVWARGGPSPRGRARASGSGRGPCSPRGSGPSLPAPALDFGGQPRGRARAPRPSHDTAARPPACRAGGRGCPGCPVLELLGCGLGGLRQALLGEVELAAGLHARGVGRCRIVRGVSGSALRRDHSLVHDISSLRTVHPRVGSGSAWRGRRRSVMSDP